jgi:hypothetical protein
MKHKLAIGPYASFAFNAELQIDCQAFIAQNAHPGANPVW